MSVKEMAEKYSKKWGVSMEEAEDKVKRFLAKRPQNDSSSEEHETEEDLFPTPLGPISRKVMDINRAAVSTATTRRLLANPPKDVEELRSDFNDLYKRVGDAVGGLEDKIEALTASLDESRRKEERQALLEEVEQRVGPMRQDLEAIKAAVDRGPPAAAAEPEEIFTKATSITDKAKGLLESAGYKVTSGQVSREEVQKMIEDIGKKSLEEIPTSKLKERLEEAGYKVEPVKLSREEVEKMIAESSKRVLEEAAPDELKKRLEAAGYKVAGGPITWAEAQELIDKARAEGQETVLDDKRIEAVQGIIQESVTQIIRMFQPAVDYYFKALGTAGTPPSSPPAGSQVSSKQPQG